jgi:regulator of nucleoside diphosphate kinase
MEAITPIDRTLTELDHVRISRLLQRQPQAGLALGDAQDLEDALEAATIVPSREVQPDVVTMYTQVLLQDLASAQRSELTVCYPEYARPEAGFVSVLSPAGWGLLGMRAGSAVSWPMPGGGQRRVEILAILFQPESSGDYLM